MYQDVSDKKFVQLIFTSEGSLGLKYVEEARTRRSVVIPFLCDVLAKEGNYRFEDKRFWGVIHAVHILGILEDLRAFEALLSASKFSHKYDIDWIWDALPECYLRLGNGAIPKLMSHIEAFKHDSDLVSGEIFGLWNLWEAYSKERKGIEDFMLKVIKDPEAHPVTRVSLIADFAQLGRKNLKPRFEGLCERWKRDFDILTREDLDYFFDSVHCPPTSHYDLEGFYRAGQADAWQEGFKGENGPGQEKVKAFILKNVSRISWNDPCPCGSGKKFGRCHLLWAERKRTRLGEKEFLN